MPGEPSACNANPVMGSLKAYLEEENENLNRAVHRIHKLVHMSI